VPPLPRPATDGVIEMARTTNSSMAALRSNHDLLCDTYTRFHLLCAACQRCVGFAREAVERVPCPVCGSELTEVYVREALSVAAAVNQ
jgi:Zn finger protein HypA/HybF involved in hydrogenase expression